MLDFTQWQNANVHVSKLILIFGHVHVNVLYVIYMYNVNDSHSVEHLVISFSLVSYDALCATYKYSQFTCITAVLMFFFSKRACTPVDQ